MMEHYGDNVRWFVGVATNNLDPLQLGRVQVRIFGIHSRDYIAIPNHALPWATVLQGTHSGGTSGIGMIPQILPGAQVFGMFLDGKESQLPCIIGVMPKIEIPSEQQLSSMQLRTATYSTGYDIGQVDPALARAAGLTTEPNVLPINQSLVGNSSVEQAFNFFTSRGFTEKQAAGIVGNLIVESGPNLPPHGPRGDGGKAAGIAQWHPGRRRIYEQVFGKPWQDTTFSDQLQFIIWELNNSDTHSGNLNKKAGDNLKVANTVEAAASIFDAQYERSSGAARSRRINTAQAVYQEYGNG